MLSMNPGETLQIDEQLLQDIEGRLTSAREVLSQMPEDPLTDDLRHLVRSDVPGLIREIRRLRQPT